MKYHIIDDDLEIVEIINPTLLVQNGQATKIHLKGFTASELAQIIETITEHGGTTVDNSKNAIVLSSATWHSKKKTTIFDIKWLYDSIKMNTILDIQKYHLSRNIVKTEVKQEKDAIKEENIKSEINPDPVTNDIEKTNVDKVQSEDPIVIISSSDEEEEEEEFESRKFRPVSKFVPSNNLDRIVIDSSLSDEESVVPKMSSTGRTEKLNISIIRETRQSSDSTVDGIDSSKLSIVSQANATTSGLNENDKTVKIARSPVAIDPDTSQSDKGSIKPTISASERITKPDDSADSGLDKSGVDKAKSEEPIIILSSSDEEGEFKSRKFKPDLKFGTNNNLARKVTDFLQSHEGSAKPGIISEGNAEKLNASCIKETRPFSDRSIGGIDSSKLTIVSPVNATASGPREKDIIMEIAGDSVVIDSDTSQSDEESMGPTTSESIKMTKPDDSINAERPDFSGRTDENIQSSPLSKFSSSSTVSQGLCRDDSTETITSDSGIILSDTSHHGGASTEPRINDENDVEKCNNSTTRWKISHSSGPVGHDISSSSSFTNATKTCLTKSRKLSDYDTPSISSETPSSEDEDVDGLKKKNEECENSKTSRTPGNYGSFTTEEEKAMIQYLIDQNAFFKAGGEVIWQLMIIDGLMKSHKPSAMKYHFENRLKYRIGDYTNDPEILKTFQLREEALETNRRLRKKRKILMELEFDE